MTRWASAHLDEIGRRDTWITIREHFGVRALGINAFVGPEAGDEIIHSHAEDWRDHEELYALAELLIEWDERVSVWRFRHYKVVARVIGDEVVGTQGTPVELLGGLIKNKLYPELWRVRTDLTELAKQSD